jgi:hypothetical protein
MTRLGYDFGGNIGSGYCWGKHMSFTIPASKESMIILPCSRSFFKRKKPGDPCSRYRML